MSALQFTLFFVALLVGYVLVHLRLVRFEEHLRKLAGIRGLDERLAQADRVLVMGAEGRGLRPSTETRVDRSVRLPLGGRVSSLNVSTAAAALLFELRRRSAGAG